MASALCCKSAFWRSAASFVVLLTCLLLTSASARAQGYFGTIGGVVADPTGAVIPGAQLLLTDQDKGFTFHATADDTGRYLFRSIPPGLYSVTATSTGFDKFTRRDLRLSVTENLAANIRLRIAGSAESVEVTAQRDSINTEDATTGQVVNRRFINDLPLVDRNVLDLTFLTAGVTEVDDQCGNCTGTNFVSNGSRGSTADILMDGASMTNSEPNGGVTQATYTPSSEAVEEFKVQQSNFSAEYGFSGASVVNMVTRSGTNEFHGSGYAFMRDQIFDANNWFNNHWGVAIPHLHRTDFGGTIGGPIRRNKTFFFFDYDGWRSSSMGNYSAGLPSTAERDGDFGEVCTAQGGSFDNSGRCSADSGQLWDPYSGTYQTPDDQAAGAYRATFVPYNNFATYASPGNPNLAGTSYQLSGAAGDLIDPVSKKMFALMPAPNITNGSQTIYKNWAASGSYHYIQNQIDLKIDHRFSENNLLSGKYSQHWDHNSSFNCFGNFTDPCANGPNGTHVHVLSLNDAHTFSPTMVLVTTFGFTRGAMKTNAYNPVGGVTDPLSTLGFPSYLNTEGHMGVPAIFLADGDYTSAASTYTGTNPWANYKDGQDTGQLTLALSKQLRSQELKTGFEGRIHQMNYLQTEAPNGIFDFSKGGTNGCPNGVDSCGGDELASFLIGKAGDIGYKIQMEPATENFQFAGYIQDNWRMTPLLTLNVGLRYDVTTPRTERHNRQEWFDDTVASPISATGFNALKGGEVFASSSNRHVVDTDFRDLQPRLGLSWQFHPGWVMRGGYGIYYSQTRAGASGTGSYSSQGYNQSTGAITSYKNDGATPWLHLSNPFPNGLLTPTGNTLGLKTDLGQTAVGSLRRMKNIPYAETWTLGVEKQLGWKTTLDAEYIGKHGVHLYYGGANQLNHLDSSWEGKTTAQINTLWNQVENPFKGVITDSTSSLSQDKVWAYQLDLPYPQFTGVTTEVPPSAYSIYHALQVTASKNYSNGLQMLVTYTWSKSIDDASVDDDNVTWLGSFLSLQDPNHPDHERSLSTFDIPAVLQASYTYALPVGRGMALLNHMPGYLEAVFGGWRTNGVWRVAGGRPLAFGLSDGVAIPTYGSQRPNLNGKPKRFHGSDWIDSYIANPSVLSKPDPYVLGSAPRATGAIRSPRSFTSNMSMEKDFLLDFIRHGLKLEFRVEAQNALNHPVFGTPNTSLDSDQFGVISYTSVAPRELQFGAKLNF